MATKFKATACEFTLHEDDWIEGEGKLISNWNEDIGEADTIVELLQKIPYLDKNFKKIEQVQDVFEHDPCVYVKSNGEQFHEPNRFDADLQVDIKDDGRIIKPTEEKWKQFEKAEVKLYALHICVHVQKVCDLDIDDVCNEGWQR